MSMITRVFTATTNALALVASLSLARRGYLVEATVQAAIGTFGTLMRLTPSSPARDFFQHHDVLACGGNMVLAVQWYPRSRAVRSAVATIAVLWPLRYVAYYSEGPDSVADAAVQAATHLANFLGWWCVRR